MANVQGQRQQQPASSDYLTMRAEHRVKLADLVIEIDDKYFADKPGGLLNGPSLKEGLTVSIPKWLILPPPEEPETVILKMAVDSGDFDREVGRHVFTVPPGGTDFPETFPFPMTIKVNDLPEDAEIRLQYTYTSFTGEDNPSQITTLICDRMPPYKHLPPSALQFADDFLDDSNLPAAGTLEATIPGYSDWKDGDKVAIYLVDAANIPEDPTTADLVFFGDVLSGTSDTTVEIDADTIREFGDAEAVFICVLIDKAQNPSAVSIQKQLSLTFGLLPANLQPPKLPQADPGPLDNEHVRQGVSVWIDWYDNYKRGDEIRLKWGTTVLKPDFPIPDNPMPTIENRVLPALLMLQEYGQTTTGIKSTPVSYEIIRKGRSFGPVSDTFPVNFEVAFPWLPWPPVDWPDPVHPSLLAGEVTNHDDSRTNQLTRADKNEPAKFTFTWYAAAVDGHVVDFFWNGTRVAEAQVTFEGPGHTPGGELTVQIPWTYIKDGGNGPTVPVHYEVTKAGVDNELRSGTTEVDVNAITVELPAASFPTFASQPNPNYPACGALENDGALQVAIPDLTGLLKDGDEIHVVFTPMRGEDLNKPDDPADYIIAAVFEDDIELGTAGHPVTGFTFLVQPHSTHIHPLYTENANGRGRVKIQYFFNDGTEDIGSVSLIKRTSFNTGTGPCPIPRP